MASPAQTWLATKVPRAPPERWNIAAPSSSSARPGTAARSSAESRVIRSPVMNSARLNACVPMSPNAPASPERRIDAPFGLLAHRILGAREPALRVAHRDAPHRAEIARSDQVARLHDHRIAAIGVGDRDQPAGTLGGVADRQRGAEAVGQRLVGQHRQPRLERGDGCGGVDVVGGVTIATNSARSAAGSNASPRISAWKLA
ncbi:MAG: hypothetical protein WDN44_08515 [Sphingomonas sp.]